MPSYALTMPFRPALDGNGVPIAGAQAVLTLTGTTTLAPVYTSTALTTEAANPVIANAAGRFGRVFLDDTVTYRLRIFDADADIASATAIEDFDPYNPAEVGGATEPNWTFATGAAGTQVVVTGTYPTQTITVPRGSPGASGALTDGTYAGIVVSGTGTALNVVNGHITPARMANMATASLLGRNTAGTGVPEVLSVATSRTLLGIGAAGLLGEATAAQYRANTASLVLTTDEVWSAAATVALTDGVTITPDLSTGINFTLAIAGNRTLANPTNPKVGQSGFIQITQDGVGTRTLAYGANWKFDGGTAPVLSTAAGTIDVLYYTVLTSTSIHATLRKAVA